MNSHLMRKAGDFRRGARWPLPSVSIVILTALLLLGSGGCGGGAPAPPPASNPVPIITSLSASSAVAGAAALTLTINGTNFLSTSTVTYNGAPHSVTFSSSNVLGIQLSASDLATAGTYPVVVTNPSPGGGVSNTYNFNVQTNTVANASLNVTISGLPATSANVVVEGPNWLFPEGGHDDDARRPRGRELHDFRERYLVRLNQ